MPLTVEKDLFRAVNEQVDPLAILKLLGWYPELVRQMGEAIHSRCPLHKGLYSTLLIDRKRRTYLCTRRSCRGHRGGGLVDLWATANRMETVRAALDLCERFHLEIDRGARAGWSMRLFDGAETAYVKRRLDEALELTQKSLELDGENLDAKLLGVSLFIEREDVGGAVRLGKELMDAFLRRNEPDRAIEIAQRLLSVEPYSAEIYQRLLRVFDAKGQHDKALTLIREMCDHHKRQGERSNNKQWYQLWLERDPSHVDARRELAELELEAGRQGEALVHLRLLRDQLLSQRDETAANEVLEKMIQIKPDDRRSLYAMGQQAFRRGERDEARRMFQRLEELYIEAQDYPNAQYCQRWLLQISPNDLPTLRRLAWVSEASGDYEKAMEVYEKALGIAEKNKDTGTHKEIKDRLTMLSDAGVARRVEAVDQLLQAGRVEEGLSELHMLADRLISLKRLDEAGELNERISSTAGNRLDHRMRVARRWEAINNKEQALREYFEVARLAEGPTNAVLRIEAGERGLALEPKNTDMLELYFLGRRDAGDWEEMLECGYRLVDTYIGQGRDEEAEGILKICLEQAPRDPDSRRRLVDLYGRQERFDDLRVWFDEWADPLPTGERAGELLDLCRLCLEQYAGCAGLRLRIIEICTQMGAVDLVADTMRVEAEVLLANGDVDAGRRILEEILALTPEDHKAVTALAKVVHKYESFDAAAPHYLHAIELRHHDAPDSTLRTAYQRVQGYDEHNLSVRSAYANYLERMSDWLAAKEQYLILADHLAEQGDQTAEAMAVLEYVSDVDPDDPSVGFKLAALCHESGETVKAISVLRDLAARLAAGGDDDSALAAYERILTMDPLDGPAGEGVADALIRRGDVAQGIERCLIMARQCLENEDEREAARSAASWLDRIVAADDTHQEALLKSARVWQSLGSVDKALERYRRLAQLLDAGDLASEESIEVYEAIVSLAPDDLPVGERLAGMYETIGRLDEAKSEYQRLSDICVSRKDVDRVEVYFKRMQALDPSDAVSAELLGRLYQKKGDSTAAFAEYKKAADIYCDDDDAPHAIPMLNILKKLNPNALDVRERLIAMLASERQVGRAVVECSELCRTAFEAQDVDCALRVANRLAQIAPDAKGARLESVRLMSQHGRREAAQAEMTALLERFETNRRWEQVLELADVALELFPDEPAYASMRLKAFKELGREGEAVTDARRLAEDYRRQGEWNAAVEAYRQVVGLAPRDLESLQALGEIYSEQGRHAEALDAFRSIVTITAEDSNFERAIQAQERIVGLEGASLVERRTLARLYDQTGRTDAMAEEMMTYAMACVGQSNPAEARAAFEAILAAVPHHESALRHLVDLYAHAGDEAGACQLLMDKGQAFMNSGDWSQAEETLLWANEMDPQNAEARRRWAVLLTKLGKKEVAIQQWKRVAELVGEYGAVLSEPESLSLSQIWTQAVALAPDDAELRVARASARESEGADSDAVDDLLSAVRLCYDQGTMARALDHCRRALAICQKRQLDEAAARAHHLLMDIYAEQNDAPRAVNEIQLLYQRYVNAGQLAEAEELLKRGLELDPENARLNVWMGETLLSLNRKGLAVKSLIKGMNLFDQMGDADHRDEILDKILVLEPDNAEVIQPLIQSLLRKGENEEAFRKMADLAKIHLQKGGFDKAEEEYRRILSYQPDNEQAWQGLIQTHERMGAPSDLTADYMGLSEVYLKVGRVFDAVQTLRKALDSDPDNVSLRRRYLELYLQVGPETDLIDDYLQLAAAYERLGQAQEARRWYKKVKALTPDNEIANEFLRRGELAATMELRRDRLDAMIQAAVNQPVDETEKIPEEQIANYRSILNINEHNTDVRIELAEYLDRVGQVDEAYQEWVKAGESLILNGSVSEGIEILEQMTRRKPNDAKVRASLSRAVLKRDAFSAIDSLFDD